MRCRSQAKLLFCCLVREVAQVMVLPAWKRDHFPSCVGVTLPVQWLMHQGLWVAVGDARHFQESKWVQHGVGNVWDTRVFRLLQLAVSPEAAS